MNKLRSTQKILTGTSILAVSVILPISQIGVLTAQAHYSPLSAPLSAPISSPETSPEPSTQPISSPISTPEPSGPTSGNDNHDSDSHSDNGGGNGGSNSSSCNAEKPKAPYITSWLRTGNNQITLNWSKPQGPVNYYAVTYGLKPHSPLYGDPHVGNGNTTKTIINGLSGQQTYYFVVQAGNDCVHSDTSNEIAVKINGAKLNTPVTGFVSKNILSASKTGKVTYTNTPTPAPVQPQTETKPASNGFFNNVTHFLITFFNH